MGGQDIVDPEFATGIIKKQLNSVINNLTIKRDELLIQQDKYNALQLEISKKGNSERVMVLLGDGYFVEHNVKDAMDFLGRRILNMKVGGKEIELKIQEARDTLKKFEDYSKEELIFEGFNGEREEKFNEEGLPYMEIREELDEEGNVLERKVNDKEYVEVIEKENEEEEEEEEEEEDDSPSTPESTSGESSEILDTVGGEDLPMVDIVEEIDELGAVISLKVEVKGSKKDEDVELAETTADLPIMEIIEELDELGKVISLNVQPENIIKEVEHGAVEEIGDEDEEEQINELLQDMEVIGTPNSTNEDELLNKLDKLDISDEDKFRLKAILLEEYRKVHQEGEDDTIVETDDNDTVTVNNKNISINQEDILELELLADEFEDEEGDGEDTQFADDEEWDFEFSDDEEDEDDNDDEDDLADQLLYGDGKAPVISNDNLNNRLWEEVISLRNKNKESTDTVRKGSSSTGSKKSVRFATELDIYEIENVGQELKNIQHVNQNYSRFMQERLTGKKIEEVSRDSIQEITESLENPVNDIIIEREVVEEEPMVPVKKEKKSRFKAMRDEVEGKSKITNDIIERDQPVNDIIERDQPVNDIIERDQPVNDIIERDQPVNDIIERDQPVNDIIERDQPVNDIIEMDQPVNDIIERDQPVNDIIERDQPVNDIIESNVNIFEREPKDNIREITIPKTSPKKSRFMLQRQSKPSFKSITLDRAPIIDGEILDRKAVIEKSISEIEDKDFKEEEEEEEEEIDEEEEIEEIKREDGEVVFATMDYQSMQDDMDTMAKAYVLGMYDDDIETQGPVIDSLDDFEAVNKIVEEREKERENNMEEGEEEEYEEEGEDEEDEEDDDKGPILLEIIERDTEFGEDDEDEIQDSIIQEEVHNNYHRLRRQLMQSRKDGYRKSDAELEFEPIDEEGNPIKVSRFRSARLM